MKVYDLLVAEDYERDGEKRTKFWNVGAAFEARDGEGLNLEIPPGVALSGRVLVRPRREREREEG